MRNVFLAMSINDFISLDAIKIFKCEADCEASLQQIDFDQLDWGCTLPGPATDIFAVFTDIECINDSVNNLVIAVAPKVAGTFIIDFIAVFDGYMCKCSDYEFAQPDNVEVTVLRRGTRVYKPFPTTPTNPFADTFCGSFDSELCSFTRKLTTGDPTLDLWITINEKSGQIEFDPTDILLEHDIV